MGERFKQFRCYLNKLVKEGREPEWDDYPTQRPYWEEFVRYKLSEEAQTISAKNTQNARKNPNPHNIGSRGIVRKLPEWQAQLEELERSGVARETLDWEMRCLIYALSHGNTHGPDGKLVSKDKRAEHLVNRIRQVREEVERGEFVPERENDVLTRALGNKEHYDRVRGCGLVPWELGFAEYSDSYRSRSRSKAQQQAVCEEVLQGFRAEMHAQNAKFRETLREQLRIKIRGEIEQTMSRPTELAAEDCGPVVVPPRSSSGSNMNPVEDPSQRFPVDEITEPKPCKLYVMAGFIKTKVAMGLAMPTQEKEVLHCRELPIGYARVTLDTLVKKSYGKVELEIPGQDDKVKLKDNIGCFVAWRKRYISLGDSDSDSSEDEENTFLSERVPTQPSPHSQPRKDPSPSPRERTPPPREPTPPRRPCNRSLLSDFHQSPVKTRSSQKQISTESSPPQIKLKKPVSGSITFLFPEKDEFKVPKKAVAHFQRMCMVPQTGSDKPPASDFERITSKRSMLEFSKIKHKQTIEDRKSIEDDFCNTGIISKEDLRRLQNEDGILLPTWPFELGKDMVSP
ncbi:unnamed protein product [Urochloa humidicola]